MYKILSHGYDTTLTEYLQLNTGSCSRYCLYGRSHTTTVSSDFLSDTFPTLSNITLRKRHATFTVITLTVHSVACELTRDTLMVELRQFREPTQTVGGCSSTNCPHHRFSKTVTIRTKSDSNISMWQTDWWRRLLVRIWHGCTRCGQLCRCTRLAVQLCSLRAISATPSGRCPVAPFPSLGSCRSLGRCDLRRPRKCPSVRSTETKQDGLSNGGHAGKGT